MGASSSAGASAIGAGSTVTRDTTLIIVISSDAILFTIFFRSSVLGFSATQLSYVPRATPTLNSGVTSVLASPLIAFEISMRNSESSIRDACMIVCALSY